MSQLLPTPDSAVDALLSRRKLMHQAAALGLLGLPFISGKASAQAPANSLVPKIDASAADYKLQLAGLPAVNIASQASARKGNKAAWPLLSGLSIAQVEIPEGTWRAAHYHSNSPEIAVIVHGRARAGLQTPQQEWLEMDLEAGDCVYFPLGWPHWLRNTGHGVLHSYFNYGHEQPLTTEVTI